MNWYRLACLVLFTGSALCACAPTHSKTTIETVDGLRVLAIPEDLDVAYIKAENGPERLCSPRFGDSAEGFSQAIGLTVGAPGIGTQGTQDGNSVRSISLGGRDPAVLMLRELLYRACELSMNLNLDKEETLKVYDKILSSAIEVVRLNAKNTGTPATQDDGKLSAPAQSTPVYDSTSGSSDSAIDSLLK